jgi:hypothetical protein
VASNEKNGENKMREGKGNKENQANVIKIQHDKLQGGTSGRRNKGNKLNFVKLVCKGDIRFSFPRERSKVQKAASRQMRHSNGRTM